MDEIVRHYGQTTPLKPILAALSDAGIDPNEVTVEDLGPVDEFHIGGRAATESLMDRAGLPARSRVLDLGSGIGGTARYLAHTAFHTVTGVDLTPEYVEIAAALTDLVGLSASVRFLEGDVCNLPLRSDSLDAAVMLHVGMNIPNKASAFEEVARVLVDGGVFAVYDIMGPADATLDYPVPWAATQAGSFLATPDEYVESLEAQGFEIDHVVDRSAFARQFFATLRNRAGPPPPLGLHLLMGSEAPERYGNMVEAVLGGTIRPTEIVATI